MLTRFSLISLSLLSTLGIAYGSGETFSVDAMFTGVPTEITRPIGFSASATIQFTVLPDPELRATTGADALIEYSFALGVLSYQQCLLNPNASPPTTLEPGEAPCAGFTSASAGFAGIEADAGGNFSAWGNDLLFQEPFGPRQVELPAGTWTASAYASAYYSGPYDGETLVTGASGSGASISFTVLRGDAYLVIPDPPVPEPGTGALLGVSLLALGLLRRHHLQRTRPD